MPVTALGAGLLFALSASTAAGTDLRAERREVVDLVTDTEQVVKVLTQRAAELRSEVAARGDAIAAADSRVQRARDRADALTGPAGLTAVSGPGVRVVLDDAPRGGDGLPTSDNPDDLVVHQQDLQAVVNALWSGGAEALAVMGQRIVATSAVRCVGNTVVLHGRVYGPPFVIEAVGDTEGMRDALDAAPGVALYRDYVDRYGLGYDVSAEDAMDLPAYDGPVELEHVTS